MTITLFSFPLQDGEGYDFAGDSSNLEKVLFGLSHTIMHKQRVLLICSQHLFGESMETILRAAEDMELVGPWGLSEDVCQRIGEARPNAVVIADEDPQCEAVAHLTAAIIEQYPELSVIRTGLNESVFRVFSTHSLPARGADLLETIRNLPPRDFDGNSSQSKIKFS